MCQPVGTGTTAGDSTAMASQSSFRSRNQSFPSSCLPSHPPSQQTTSGVADTKSTALSGAGLTARPQGIDPDVEMIMAASMGDPNIKAAASSGQ
ncbi:hypothetical protein PV04_00254 [Phialophora macrospora]|uniref:Uncharacterized protein n=1 Tax=Phialophora macrospora TaxID=1851006 RepID=A0A0D2FZY3_9EURO|nr:hypothetical protein PV04_00254 [Phialophora macrospora]